MNNTKHGVLAMTDRSGQTVVLTGAAGGRRPMFKLRK